MTPFVMVPGPTWGVHYGALSFGDWNQAGTWTPAGGPPGPGDVAHIGTAFFAGAAETSLVRLNGNQSVWGVVLGNGAGTSGTLDLGTSTLTASFMYLCDTGGQGTISRTTGSFNIYDLNLAHSCTVNMRPGDVVESLSLRSGASATTSHTGNIRDYVAVWGDSSRLTLGADLTIARSLDIKGGPSGIATVDAAGYDIEAQDIYIGGISHGGRIENDGAIVARGILSVYNAPFVFDTDDDAYRFYGWNSPVTLTPTTTLLQLYLDQGSTSTLLASTNVSHHLSVTGANSRLDLNADVNVVDFVRVSGDATTEAIIDARHHRIVANDIAIGYQGARGRILNQGDIIARARLFVDGVPFVFDSQDDTNELHARNAEITLVPSTQMDTVSLAAGASMTILATSNVARYVTVMDPSTRLRLEADLDVTDSIHVLGSDAANPNFDANGRNIEANYITLGGSGLPGSIANDGAIRAWINLGVWHSHFEFDSNDSTHGISAYDSSIVARPMELSSIWMGAGSTVTMRQPPGGQTGLSVGTLLIDSSSVLELTLDPVPQPGRDWVLRWHGNRVADLHSLITSGRIVITQARPYTIDFDPATGYTYLGYFLPDYNGDQVLSCGDLDALTTAIVHGPYQPIYDLNRDQLLTVADRDIWLAEAGAMNLTSAAPFLPGDGNLDGSVDGSDFGVWNSNKFTATAAWCRGDYNTNGFVDDSDFGIWNMNKFRSAGSTILVPEPMAVPSFVLLIFLRSLRNVLAQRELE